METETANDRFERLAAEFYRETGIMAPGKDCPPELGQPDFGERWAAFMNWQEQRRFRPAVPTTTQREG